MLTHLYCALLQLCPLVTCGIAASLPRFEESSEDALICPECGYILRTVA